MSCNTHVDVDEAEDVCGSRTFSSVAWTIQDSAGFPYSPWSEVDCYCSEGQSVTDESSNTGNGSGGTVTTSGDSTDAPSYGISIDDPGGGTGGNNVDPAEGGGIAAAYMVEGLGIAATFVPLPQLKAAALLLKTGVKFGPRLAQQLGRWGHRVGRGKKSDIQELAYVSGRFRDAKRKGNTNIGSKTSKEADGLGSIWVGGDAKKSKNGLATINENGRRQYRGPYNKRSGRRQANFESRNDPAIPWTGNVHLDIKD